MTSRLGGASLFTPMLLAETAQRRVNLASEIERSRDLVWLARRLRSLGARRFRPIAGGAADDVTADSQTQRSRTTQQTILTFLRQHGGEAFCADCITRRLFDGRNIDVAMRHLEGSGVHRRHARCSACGKSRLIALLPAQS
jgi:hypothetical protein